GHGEEVRLRGALLCLRAPCDVPGVTLAAAVVPWQPDAVLLGEDLGVRRQLVPVLADQPLRVAQRQAGLQRDRQSRVLQHVLRATLGLQLLLRRLQLGVALLQLTDLRLKVLDGLLGVRVGPLLRGLRFVQLGLERRHLGLQLLDLVLGGLLVESGVPDELRNALLVHLALLPGPLELLERLRDLAHGALLGLEVDCPLGQSEQRLAGLVTKPRAAPARCGSGPGSGGGDQAPPPPRSRSSILSSTMVSMASFTALSSFETRIARSLSNDS